MVALSVIVRFFFVSVKVFNQFRAKGRLSEKDGLDIEDWSYELRGNKITGSMQIPDLNIQGFKFELASEDFQALPSLILSDSWTADGSVNFKISGDGNLNELKDSRLAGKMNLINEDRGLIEGLLRNQYWILFTRGTRSMHLYSEDPEVRDFLNQRISEFQEE